MKRKISKYRVSAIILSATVLTGSFTYVNNHKNYPVRALTVEDLEDQIADNQQKINDLEDEMSDIDDEIAYAEKQQELLKEKIDIQAENIDMVNTKINDINKKIDEKEKSISQLEADIESKQADIDKGLEEFKSRLRAMYVSGNDSLASALVGATDFYDMLTKMELIAQVSKHDNELINSLMTQLDQFEEARAQLDIEKQDYAKSLEEQQEYKKELNDAIEQLNADYQNSQDYIDRQEKEKAARQADIDAYEQSNDDMNSEIDEINRIAKQQAQSSSSSYSDNSYEEDNSNDDSSDDTGYDSSGDGEIGGSSGSGSYSGALTWPVPGFYGISSGYGYRWGSLHAGIDISDGGIHGASVVAADSGTVILVKTGCTHDYGKDYSCGCNGGYGNYLMIDHGNGISTLYGHCSSVYVSVGQTVSAGETVASVGSTGWSTGNHLHFEVRINGSTVDPTGYLY